MLVREFLTRRLALLWSLKGVEDDLRLRPDDLSSEELSKAMCTFLQKDPGVIPEAYLPL